MLHLKGFGELMTAPVGKGYQYFLSAGACGTNFADQTWMSGAQARWLEFPPGSENQVAVDIVPGPPADLGSGTVAGRVMTAGGTPVAGAKVELLRKTRVMYDATTDEHGSFVISNVPATSANGLDGEPFVVRVSKQGFYTTREFFAGTELLTGLKVPATGTLIKVELRPTEQKVSGTVLGESGKPLAGAVVTLRSDGDAEPLQATTAATGRYEFAAVPVKPAVRYFLQVRAADYQASPWQDVTQSVLQAEVVPVMGLQRAQVVLGGRVFEFGGKPLQGVKVELRTDMGEALASAVTDSRGSYRLDAHLPKDGVAVLVASQERECHGGKAEQIPL